ncbi:MAG: hypothetical protein HKL96_06965 [Phycisphaerales bacterium]|nr:hypothetical protein [Phycisphaerales bacterium]
MQRFYLNWALLATLSAVLLAAGYFCEPPHTAHAAVVATAAATASASAKTSSAPVPAWLVGHSRKKGICMGKGQGARTWDQMLELLHVGWVYNWMLRPRGRTPTAVSFIPMDWGHRWELARDIPWLTAQHLSHHYKYVLTFNEPDNRKQANIPVQQALDMWPKLESTGMVLGSPACVHPNGPWMRRFMRGAAAKHYRVEFVCVHWYGAPNAKAFLRMLHQTYTHYHRPIWITEFAVADWHASREHPNAYSQATVERFMKAVLPVLNRLHYVQRYAWFPYGGTSRYKPLGCSGLFDKQGNLTPLGQVYASY